jgi:hypothetical protein
LTTVRVHRLNEGIFVKKNITNKKIRLVLRSLTVRDLRRLSEQELEQAVGAVGCGTPATSFGQEVCTIPH